MFSVAGPWDTLSHISPKSPMIKSKPTTLPSNWFHSQSDRPLIRTPSNIVSGLTTACLIRYHPSTIRCGAYGSVLLWLQGAATGGIGDSFVLLPRVLWCWVSFARVCVLATTPPFCYLFSYLQCGYTNYTRSHPKLKLLYTSSSFVYFHFWV